MHRQVSLRYCYVDLQLRDYRDLGRRRDGSAEHYDAVVSIEMIEAVGEAYWPVYFQTLKNRLKPGGSAVIQAITIDEAHFEAYRSSPDFIQRCIFPGGMLPTPERIAELATPALKDGFMPLDRSNQCLNRLLKNWIGRSAGAFPRTTRPKLTMIRRHHGFVLSFHARKFARRPSTTSLSAAC